MTRTPAQLWKQATELLDVLFDLPEQEQAAYLDRACADDPVLRKEVVSLLAQQDKAGRLFDQMSTVFLAPLLSEMEQTGLVSSPLKGQQIGPYRLGNELGRGGMGVVFLAHREDQQFEQQVAIKLIKRGMDSREILRRFLHERRILASLDHPHIGRLFDGGVTEEGQPYFVMEYIEGTPLLVYCDAHRLSIEARLALFRTVCAAVQYAHLNLIVHRDLKPSNILVTKAGVVKLLDFGIAKLLDEDTALTAPLTWTGIRMMTPEYASPEQVRGEVITTASDVYALGVIMYELLTGHRPYRWAGRAPAEVERVICEEEPTRPSTMITQAEEVEHRDGTTRLVTPEQVSAARSVSQDQLSRRLRGDLDTIVLKALQKEPSRRYRSAEQLSEDVQRHLVGLPVWARRDTLGYRVGKFIRRHRWEVAAVLVIVLLLVGYTMTVTVQSAALRTRSEELMRERDKAEEVVAFLVALFEASDPSESRGIEVTARELLERGREKVEEELSGQPAVQAEMLGVMGAVYHSLGEYEAADSLLRQALTLRQALHGATHPDVAESMNALGMLLYDRGDHAAAEPLFRQALAMRRAMLDAGNPALLTTLNNLGRARWRLGDYAAAERLLRESLALQRERLGNDHPDVGDGLNNLAMFLLDKGDFEAAEPLMRETLALDRKLHGEEHPYVALDLDNLGGVLLQMGDYEAAESLIREALHLHRKLFGDQHPKVAASLWGLATALHEKGNLVEAESLHREALDMRQQVFDKNNQIVARSLISLGEVLYDKGDLNTAESSLRQALLTFRTALSEKHPRTAGAQVVLGQVLVQQGRPEEAEPLLREAVPILLENFGDADRRTAEAQAALGACLAALRLFDEAEPLLVNSYTVLDTKHGPAHRSTERAREALIALYNAWDKPERATLYRNE